MATAQPTTDAAATRSQPPKFGMAAWIAVTFVAGAAGFAAPLLVPKFWPTAPLPLASPGSQPSPQTQGHPVFIPFGEVVVNLDEGRLNRYLRLNITLQIEESDQFSVQQLIDRKKAILRNWLLSFLSDQDMETIRGAAGQNRLRREIQDHFNTVLFPDGYDRIHDILFEEFNVQ